MRLIIIGSNSDGNSYILETEDQSEALLIECGVRFDKIQQALKFNLNKVVACLITHEHKDHCKSVRDVLSRGIPVWASNGTHMAMGTMGHNSARTIRPDQINRAFSFQFIGFDTKHDCVEPMGFLIKHKECGTVLFLTDSYYTPYYFPGLNNVIVEANYCQKILDARMISKDSPAFLRDRVLTSHMSIDNCKEMLQANDLSAVNHIVLIHLSNNNSDSSRFKSEVEAVTGKTVHVADAGMVIENFNLSPF